MQDAVGGLVADPVDQVAADAGVLVGAGDRMRTRGAARRGGVRVAAGLAAPAAPGLASGAAGNVGVVGKAKEQFGRIVMRN